VDRRKELQLQYKQMKPDMGIYAIKSKSTGKCYLQSTPDLKSAINGTLFKLNAGMHANKELQADWSRYPEADFSVEILERLKYDKDPAKTDYCEELELLRLIWEEKIAREHSSLYNTKSR